MRLALLLPFILCSNSLSAFPSPESRVQIYLHISKTATIFLHPLDLERKEDFPGLFQYGFAINTHKIIPKKITVSNQTLNIPMGAKALLLTLPKRQEEGFCQDIQLVPFPLPSRLLPEFQSKKLKEYHVPIYLQFAETPVKTEHGRKQEPCHLNEKEEKLFESQCPAGVSDSENRENPVPIYSQLVETSVEARLGRKGTSFLRKMPMIPAQKTVCRLFRDVSGLKWPIIVIGYINAIDHNNGHVQIIEPLIQTASAKLDSRYFSFRFRQDSVHAYIMIQDQQITLTEELKAFKKKKNNGLIIIEMDIIGKREDKSIIFPLQSRPIVRHANRKELKGIPGKFADDHINIYFQFKRQKDTNSSNSPRERPPGSL